jgi:hypothetical protein
MMTEVTGGQESGGERLPGQIKLYEGNGCSQHVIDTKGDEPGQRFRPSQNDEARSLSLAFVRVGAVIRVFDSPSGSTGDDYTEIEVMKTHPDYCIRTFESSFADEYVQVRYNRVNGLDGKVSLVTID